ncbi:hypothetical protein OAT16_06240 [Prolixibacteraceae bacterium]|nr:hypothetical protein [Prolixibacteraceae bacterium]
MKLEQFFHIWLERHDCIIIPNIGALIVQHISAKWDSSERVFNVPHDIISFNNHIVKDNGILASLICAVQKCSFKEASDMIVDWTLWCYKELSEGNKILIDHLGTLSMDHKGYISMKMISKKSSIKIDCFGLEDVVFQNLSHATNTKIAHYKSKVPSIVGNNHILSKVTAAAALVLMLCIPRSFQHHIESSLKASFFPSTEALNMDQENTVYYQSITEVQIQIIAGSFHEYANASSVLDKLEKILPSKFHIISKEGGIYQVCSTQLFLSDSASQTVDVIKSSFPGLDLWKKKVY